MTLKSSTDESVTTLTLVRWSAEIAKGMEYLAYKGVIFDYSYLSSQDYQMVLIQVLRYIRSYMLI